MEKKNEGYMKEVWVIIYTIFIKIDILNILGKSLEVKYSNWWK